MLLLKTMTHDIDPIIFDLFEFRPRKGDLKKLEIIKATIDCLAKIGIENTTFEAIAQTVGTRRAHIAYHFSDKDLLFLSCIKYILATYQQLAIDTLKDAGTGDELLTQYVKAPFVWAKKHPEQLTVMFLLYYHSRMNDEYLTIHTQVRKGGHDRLIYILTEKLKMKGQPDKIKNLAWSILNLISGQILNTATTKTVTLEQAMEDTVKIVKKMVSE